MMIYILLLLILAALALPTAIAHETFYFNIPEGNEGNEGEERTPREEPISIGEEEVTGQAGDQHNNHSTD